MTIRETEFPEFAPAVRGYDRTQVDDYVRRLREYASGIEDRSLEAEQRVEEREREANTLRARLAEALDAERSRPAPAPLPPVPADATTAVPAPVTAVAEVAPPLTERLARILALAEEEAEDVRSSARTEADSLLAEARNRARRDVAEADQREARHRSELDAQVEQLRTVRDELVGELSGLHRRAGEALGAIGRTTSDPVVLPDGPSSVSGLLARAAGATVSAPLNGRLVPSGVLRGETEPDAG